MGNFEAGISKAVIVGLMLSSLNLVEKQSAFFEIMYFNGRKASPGRSVYGNQIFCVNYQKTFKV